MAQVTEARLVPDDELGYLHDGQWFPVPAAAPAEGLPPMPRPMAWYRAVEGDTLLYGYLLSPAEAAALARHESAGPWMDNTTMRTNTGQKP